MSWGWMGLSKASGGMGFRDFLSFNKALLAKQAWRLWSQPESLVAKIMRAKYFSGSRFWRQNWDQDRLLLGEVFLVLVIYSGRDWFGEWETVKRFRFGKTNGFHLPQIFGFFPPYFFGSK
jgi:hypothetical protein